ncbi:DUF6082 family protein [Nonomuraea sp. NPDC046802]|uniref:DUF6082 family protein n=1 Tax=Nonomuraea sp. NPDC046802 TaxID=3154919 RepID=UPI0033C9B40B
MTRRARRTILIVSIALGVLLSTALLLLAPVAMGSLVKVIPGLDWALLSAIGQAYGSVAALLTALSLAGVVVSILVQARSVRVASEQTWRTTQLELAKLCIDDPKLVQAEGSPWRGPDDDLPLKLQILANLWIEQWRSMHNVGLMDDSEIRRLAQYLFTGEVGRRHWAMHSSGYRADRRNARTRDFSRILDEELTRAALKPAVPTVVPRPASDRKGWLLAVAAGAALALGVAVGRSRSGHHKPGRP